MPDLTTRHRQVTTGTIHHDIPECCDYMHQPKLQDELNFSTPNNTPTLFESITIYVSNLEYLAVMGCNAFMQLPMLDPQQELTILCPVRIDHPHLAGHLFEYPITYYFKSNEHSEKTIYH